MKIVVFLIILLISGPFSYSAKKNSITVEKNKIKIQADIIKRIISLDQATFCTKDVLINNSGNRQVLKQNVSWIKLDNFKSENWSGVFNTTNYTIICKPSKGIKLLNIRVRSVEIKSLDCVAINLFYEICEDYPIIREFCNRSYYNQRENYQTKYFV